MRRIFRELVPVFELDPPGRYGDGRTYLRVRKDVDSAWRAGSGLPLGHADPEHVFIPAANSHAAYAYRAWLLAAHVPSRALAVVRILA